MGHNYNVTLAEVLKSASVFLETHDFSGDLARTYYMMWKDLSLTELVNRLRESISVTEVEQFQQLLNRIVQHEPIQYILGYADVAGVRFKVTPSTLIPREDTVGLIPIIEQAVSDKLTGRLVDIGTGSGLLAILLKQALPTWQVIGVDISRDALAVAQENGEQLDMEIEWLQSDVLNQFSRHDCFDVIVSNPPYIGKHEVDLMDESVKRFEPPLALFAEEDGLAIYRKIAEQAPKFLANDGVLALEIGFSQGEVVSKMMKLAFPSAKVTVEQDLNGHHRYVIVQNGKGRFS